MQTTIETFDDRVNEIKLYYDAIEELYVYKDGEYKNKNTRAIKIQALLWEKDFNAGMMEDYNLSLSEG